MQACPGGCAWPLNGQKRWTTTEGHRTNFSQPFLVLELPVMSFRQHIDFNASPPREAITHTRNSYTLQHKVNLINQVTAQGGFIRRVAHDNGLHHSTLQKWMKQEAELKQEYNDHLKHKRLNRYRVHSANKNPGFGQEVEASLLAFVKAKRSHNLRVTPTMIIAHWRAIDPTAKDYSMTAQRHRVGRFMKRNNLVHRKGTHQAQKQAGATAIINDFVEYIKYKMSLLGITNPAAVVNADETNVYFSPKINSTVCEKGSRTVSIAHSQSSSRCTVMLGGSIDGRKLPPFVIFNGKRVATAPIYQAIQNPEKNGYHPALRYNVQRKAWMDEDLMLYWIDQVWKPYANSIPGPTLLLLDMFQAHLTTHVQWSLAQCGTTVEFIPGGYTSKLQAMDVGINKPFKDHMRNFHEEYMGECAKEELSPKVCRPLVSQWIGKAWDSIPPLTFVKTWKHILGDNPIPSLEEITPYDPLGMIGDSPNTDEKDEAYNSDASLDY